MQLSPTPELSAAMDTFNGSPSPKTARYLLAETTMAALNLDPADENYKIIRMIAEEEAGNVMGDGRGAGMIEAARKNIKIEEQAILNATVSDQIASGNMIGSINAIISTIPGMRDDATDGASKKVDAVLERTVNELLDNAKRGQNSTGSITYKVLYGNYGNNNPETQNFLNALKKYDAELGGYISQNGDGALQVNAGDMPGFTAAFMKRLEKTDRWQQQIDANENQVIHAIQMKHDTHGYNDRIDLEIELAYSIFSAHTNDASASMGVQVGIGEIMNSGNLFIVTGDRLNDYKELSRADANTAEKLIGAGILSNAR